MRTYEIVLVVKTGSDVERKKITDLVKGMLKGLKVTKDEDLGSKALSYKIKGELTGHYYNFVVEADTFPADFEKKLTENTSVLRHLVLRVK